VTVIYVLCPFCIQYLCLFQAKPTYRFYLRPDPVSHVTQHLKVQFQLSFCAPCFLLLGSPPPSPDGPLTEACKPQVFLRPAQVLFSFGHPYLRIATFIASTGFLALLFYHVLFHIQIQPPVCLYPLSTPLIMQYYHMASSHKLWTQ
jgi:hypothetical protein